MGLTRQQIQERNKRKRVRNIVVTCGRLAKKYPSDEMVDLMTNHITTVLPHKHMSRLMKGDFGQPMWEVVKLTLPYFG
jgi:hypothetical protein